MVMLVFPCFADGGTCPPDSWAAGVAPSLDSLALVVLSSVQGCHDAAVSKHCTKQNDELTRRRLSFGVSTAFQGNLGDWYTLLYNSSPDFMYPTFSMHIASKVL